jgi:hypothetical protein
MLSNLRGVFVSNNIRNNILFFSKVNHILFIFFKFYLTKSNFVICTVNSNRPTARLFGLVRKGEKVGKEEDYIKCLVSITENIINFRLCQQFCNS